MNLKSLSIVFPFFNEEKRLKLSFQKLKKTLKDLKNIDVEIILVNDGSYDASDIMAKKFISKLNKSNKKKIKYISYKKNKGKGYAVKMGVLKAKKKWVLTCDIDFSAEPKNILNWQKNNFVISNKICYFGSRRKYTKDVRYKLYRKVLGDLFVGIKNLLFNINILDTQCGFKLYPRKIARKIFQKITEYGYIHDIEISILLKKKSINVVELPVKWTHVSGSKLNIFTDGAAMIFRLIVLSLKY